MGIKNSPGTFRESLKDFTSDWSAGRIELPVRRSEPPAVETRAPHIHLYYFPDFFTPSMVASPSGSVSIRVMG